MATADLFPKFNLAGSFGFSASDVSRLERWTSNFWSWGPTVTWPIFAGGRIYCNIKVQDALQEQALLTYEKTVLTALKDVETALVAYAKQQETRKSLSEAVVNNRKAVDLAMKLYVAGKSDFLNVLIAQRIAVCHRRCPGAEHPHRGYQPDCPLQGVGRRLGKGGAST